MLSLANGVVGVLHAAVLSIHAIGRGYASAVAATRNTASNRPTGRSVTTASTSGLFANRVGFVVGQRKELVVAPDWTDFDADDHSTLAAYLITSPGRATPLVWKSFEKATIKAHRNEYEYSVIELHECLAPDVSCSLIAASQTRSSMASCRRSGGIS